MSTKPMSTSADEWLINFDVEENLFEKHSFEIEGKVRVMPDPSSDIQKNTTFLTKITNEKVDLMPNVAGSGFHHQNEYNCGESSHILHSSGYFGDFHVSHSSNLRSSTPKSSIVFHSNNLHKTPEIASPANRPCNLQSSTPKASSRLTPFASDLTHVDFMRKNIHDINQNTEAKNFGKLNSDISNDLFEFQNSVDSLEQFKNSNYEDCVGSSLNFLKLRCHSTQNTSQMSTYFSANGLKTPATDVKLPRLTDKALKVPNESPTNSVNEYKMTENVLKSLNTDSCGFQGNFSPLNSSEEKYIDEVNKACISESLFESDLISLQDNLECKPNGNCVDKINLIDFSSDLNSKSFSSVNETPESTDQLAFRDYLDINSYNESVNEIMLDILNRLSPEICDKCPPDHFTEEKACLSSDESNSLKEVFWVNDNTENLMEVSKVESLESKPLNLDEFLADTWEINEKPKQSGLNSENDNLKIDSNLLKVCNNSTNNITAYFRTLGGKNPKTIETQDFSANTSQKHDENSFRGINCKELSNLISGTFSSVFDIFSDLAKPKIRPEELFIHYKTETLNSKKFAKQKTRQKFENFSNHMGKLALGKLRPLKMVFEGGSDVSNFKTLLGKNIENINLFNLSICKVPESTLNFEVPKEVRLSCNHNLNSLIPSVFPHCVTISLHKLLANKKNSLNYSSNQSHMKDVASVVKPQYTLSNNSDTFLKADLFSVNNQPSVYVQNGISLEICGSSTNSKFVDAQQISNESKVFEHLESDKDKCLDSGIIFKSKDSQHISNSSAFAPMYDEALSSQSNVVSRFPGDISETSNNFPAKLRQDASIKSNKNYLSDSSECFETDIHMTSNSDSESSMESNKKATEHESKSLLQDLFDIDKMVAKAVVQTFTDLGSRRGLKLSQIIKHINQRKMIKVHSKLNQDIKNFLKVSCEVGIIRKKRFKYFLSEQTSSLSKKRKGTNSKCKAPKRKDELKVESNTSTKIKTRRGALEMKIPTGIKTRRAVFQVETLGSTKIKVKRDLSEMKTPTRIKTERASFQVETPASERIKTGRASFRVETPATARIKKLRKNSSSSSNAKCLFSGNKRKSVCQSERVLGSPIIYKKLRSRVILLKKDG